MPDCILDVKAGKKSSAKEHDIITKSLSKLDVVADDFNNQMYHKQGLSFFSRVLGFLVQRLWVGHYSKSYKDKPKINHKTCVTCGICTRLCPMENLKIIDHELAELKQCTLCYRCVHACPTKSLTIFGKEVRHASVNLSEYQ